MTKTYIMELTEEQAKEVRKITGISVLGSKPEIDWYCVKNAIRSGEDLTDRIYEVTLENGKKLIYSPTPNPYGDGYIFVPDRLLSEKRPMIDNDDVNLRCWLNRDFRDMLPDNLQDVLSTDKNGDEIFIPHEVEVFGTNIYSSPDEYIKYKKWDCFTDSKSRIRTRNGETDWYWLASPAVSHSTYFCHVSTSGTPSAGNAGGSIGVLPCFMIAP